jgi:signal transduction histidine kinase
MPRPEGSDPALNEQRLHDRLARMERLLQLNELLVAGLVHDLRTPLMAIRLSAEVAVARTHDEAVQQAARRIRAGSDRMSRTFDHLLNLARVGAEVAEPDLQPADLLAVAAAVLDELRADAGGIAFDVTHEGDPVGLVDAGMLQEVLRNVVATVLEHAGSTGIVALHVDGSHRDRLSVRIAVPTVIPADVQERLYVPGRNSAGREVPGLGLGLAPVDGFVRAHGGSIVGRSRAPEGTVFELLLPRGAAPA